MPPLTDETYLAKKKLTEGKAIDFLLYAGIGPQTKPLSFPAPYKVFMGPSVGDLFFQSFQQLEKTISRYRGCTISFHCENPCLIYDIKQSQYRKLNTGRPPEAEISAIEFAIFLIEKYELRGKICHCSTKEGVAKVREAKLRGVAVTCEVTPHHLYFDESTITQENKRWLQVNPPMRSTEDRKAVVEALRDGTIDFIASDHAPHTREEKQKGISGMPHLDTYGAFATWLMKEHNFQPKDIARVCAYNPGQFVNQFTETPYGKIEKGYAASFTIIDPTTPTTFSAAELRTKCKWSPFEGMEFPGQVLYTIHRGKVAYEKV